MMPASSTFTLKSPDRERNHHACRGNGRTRTTARSRNKLNHAGRGGAFASSAISADDLTRVRAVGVVGTHLKTETLGNTQTPGNTKIRLPASFQSALPSPGADASGSRGFILLALRRWLDFSRRFQAPGSLFFRLTSSIPFQAGKQTTGCTSKAFHFDLSAPAWGLAGAVGRTPTNQKETRKCPTIEWRNPT